MTTDEFIKKQEAKIQAIIKYNKPLEIAVKSIMSVQSKRVFIDGKNADGGIIGEYKENEVYLNPKSLTKGATRTLPNFQLKGKEGQTKFLNGNDHKTGYFKSYKDFKKSIGRNTKISTVDLFLTGTLINDWSNAKGLAAAEAQKVNVNNYIVGITQLSYDKVSRYGNVLNLSKKEKELFLKVIQFELTNALK